MRSGGLGSADKQTSSAVLATLALVCFSLGLAIYLLDRPWASAAFLADFAHLQPARLNVFGALGGSLPSFLHACTFCCLLLLALGPAARHRAALACGLWFGLATLLELMQGDAFSALLSSPAIAFLAPLTSQLEAYAVHGHFDSDDVIASALGCLAAYFTLRLVRSTPCIT